MSDADGKFNIKVIPAGRYRLFASHTGYVDQQFQSAGVEKGAVLALRVGEAVKDVLFVRPGEEGEADFILRRVKTVEVSGKVIGIDGKPATDCYVVIFETPNAEFSLNHNASPDSKGEFKIRGVPPGSYLLMAEQNSSSDERR